ncbi:hypothetical protein [Vibrio alginolyticus]|uniref:hypothetical protein n=1 Tax=Vibrio alginolyticus TaxID=663 RepID=UPI001BD26844|nr:hypothetical protein [Vibrio alginolyticus]MBS9974349.1 hypothetical protein [Vibrio alginolyticus]MBT0020400.1 hypothetical protein [Vibrio alginolyticus]MCS0036245.1 hypothetical protein [Vibrio alginolyticus]
MQYAKCTQDGKTWEISKFSELESSLLDIKRRSLVCTECGEFAWYRRESRHGHPAHFCAHHDPECDLKVQYISSDEHRDDATEVEGEVESDDTIIVRLDQEQGGAIDVAEVSKPPLPGLGEGGKRYVLKDKNRRSAQQFTLRRILHRLVKSKDFRNSESNIIFYRNNEEIMLSGHVKDIVFGFNQIEKDIHHGKTNFYWGPIASARESSDGKIWLNSSSEYMSASVAIFEDISDDFKELFEVDDLEDLLGAHVLVAGNCYFSGEGEGKPIIWCGTPNYIFVRKYKDPAIVN